MNRSWNSNYWSRPVSNRSFFIYIRYNVSDAQIQKPGWVIVLVPSPSILFVLQLFGFFLVTPPMGARTYEIRKEQPTLQRSSHFDEVRVELRDSKPLYF